MKCLYSKDFDTTIPNPKEIERYLDAIADNLSLEKTFQNYIDIVPSDDECHLVFWGVIALDIINEKVNIKAIQDDILSKFHTNIPEKIINEFLFYNILPKALEFEIKYIEKQENALYKMKEISQTYYHKAFMLLEARFSK